MGLLDFIKDAGERVFGDKDDEKEVYKPIRQHVEDQGINTDGMDFRFSNGVLVISGIAPSQEVREKVVTIAGNIKGVGQVDDQLRIGVAQPDMVEPSPDSGQAHIDAPWESRTYTVERGDTLSAIARKMYGDASKYPIIFEANKPMLKDPDKIYPGQVLRIPSDD